MGVMHVVILWARYFANLCKPFFEHIWRDMPRPDLAY